MLRKAVADTAVTLYPSASSVTRVASAVLADDLSAGF